MVKREKNLLPSYFHADGYLAFSPHHLQMSFQKRHSAQQWHSIIRSWAFSDGSQLVLSSFEAFNYDHMDMGSI